MAEETIFTKIIKGSIPSFKVYEDEYAYAFMDIHPIQPGHVLVVSKKPYETFEVMEDEDYQGLMNAVKLVAGRIKEEFKPRRIGVMIEGFEVDHAHVKVFPVNDEHEFRNMPNQDQEPDFQMLEEMAKKLRF